MTQHPDIAAFTSQITAIRHEIHRLPELLYDLPRTSHRVADALKSFGCDEVITGLGQSGVVALIHGKRTDSQRKIGLRADMDALPIFETTNLGYASTLPGQMHACGHDGHTAMLLGACAVLAKTRAFNGTVVAIFQPAEEGGAGAKAMIDDGLFERFPVDEVYGLHNLPGLPLGEFAICEGPIMASADWFQITLTGAGGHAAQPQRAHDPVLACGHLIVAAQSIVSRNVDPLQACVVSITTLNAGTANNIIPDEVVLRGTIRTLDKAVRQFAAERLQEICAGIARTFAIQAEFTLHEGYPVCHNHKKQTDIARKIGANLSQKPVLAAPHAPMMAAEDFAYMLEACPGAYMLIGNGDSANLHSASYDFNDGLIPKGMAYWTALVEDCMPL